MKTKVLFLFEKLTDEFLIEENRDSTPQVFAYFPDEIYSDARSVLRSCYAHVGQHSACHPDYAKECKEADYDSYNDLKIELEGIGYKLEVLNKDFARQNAISKGKVWTVRKESDKENDLFEGNKTECLKYIKAHGLRKLVKAGTIRLGQLIYEPSIVT